jgi:hypothetical protein
MMVHPDHPELLVHQVFLDQRVSLGMKGLQENKDNRELLGGLETRGRKVLLEILVRQVHQGYQGHQVLLVLLGCLEKEG